MKPIRRSPHRAARRACLVLLCTLLPWSAQGHETRAGDIVIEHAYATPSPAGQLAAAVYFRALRNEGRAPERLLGAQTPIARQVTLQRGAAAIAAIELPAGSVLKLRHDGDTRLALTGLQQPLKDGDHFALTLRFERAGERELTVWVQQPRAAAAAARH